MILCTPSPLLSGALAKTNKKIGGGGGGIMPWHCVCPTALFARKKERHQLASVKSVMTFLTLIRAPDKEEQG